MLIKNPIVTLIFLSANNSYRKDLPISLTSAEAEAVGLGIMALKKGLDRLVMVAIKKQHAEVAIEHNIMIQSTNPWDLESTRGTRVRGTHPS